MTQLQGTGEAAAAIPGVRGECKSVLELARIIPIIINAVAIRTDASWRTLARGKEWQRKKTEIFIPDGESPDIHDMLYLTGIKGNLPLFYLLWHLLNRLCLLNKDTKNH